MRPATQQDAIHTKNQDIPKLLLALYGVEGETSSNEDPETRALESALARERETHQPQWAPSASGILLVFQGHVFQSIQYRLPTNCEFCAKPLSHLISPPHALECKRCHLKVHREHVPAPAVGALGTDTLTPLVGAGAASGNQPSIDLCKVASVDVKSLFMMLPSPREQKYWIAQLTKRIPKPVASSATASSLSVPFLVHSSFYNCIIPGP